jgi:hypothetical protein
MCAVTIPGNSGRIFDLGGFGRLPAFVGDVDCVEIRSRDELVTVSDIDVGGIGFGAKAGRFRSIDLVLPRSFS